MTFRPYLILISLILGSNQLSTAFADDPLQAAMELEGAIHLTPDLDNGMKVYYTCAVCHKPEAWGSENGHFPQIAGQLSTVIIKQLADIRARNRDNPTMLPFTKLELMSLQEIADVSAYIAKLPMTRDNGVGPGTDLVYGKQIYEDNCIECHGPRGEGNLDDHIPLLQGQHYHYLYRQFIWIRDGRRRNADKKMVRQIQGFKTREISAVMDYVSRLRPPEEKLAPEEWQNPDFPKYKRNPNDEYQR
jgi:cytochrome c553